MFVFAGGACGKGGGQREWCLGLRGGFPARFVCGACDGRVCLGLRRRRPAESDRVFSDNVFSGNHLKPKDYPIHGIDVSKFQGDIDWNAVANSGVKFA